jgi:hypothetical protein
MKPVTSTGNARAKGADQIVSLDQPHTTARSFVSEGKGGRYRNLLGEQLYLCHAEDEGMGL